LQGIGTLRRCGVSLAVGGLQHFDLQQGRIDRLVEIKGDKVVGPDARGAVDRIFPGKFSFG
jgi:hypothetical protein